MNDLTPLTTTDLIEMGTHAVPIPPERILATFADPKNWVQLYDGESSPISGYKAKACEWVFIGPMRPPYELAQHGIKTLKDQ